MPEELAKLTADELQRYCYRYREEHDLEQQAANEYCFEIFRRAIAENDQACWAIMYEEYEKLVQKWLYESIKDDYIGDTHISELVIRAFEKLWRFFDTPQLAAARNLCSVLAYLKSCAMTCIEEELRRLVAEGKRAEREVTYSNQLPKPASLEGDILRTEFLDRLWQEILACCNREPPEQFQKEQLIAWLTFRNGLKPERIYTENAGIFVDVNEIYDLKRKLMARLRNSPGLRHLRDEGF